MNIIAKLKNSQTNTLARDNKYGYIVNNKKQRTKPCPMCGRAINANFHTCGRCRGEDD